MKRRRIILLALLIIAPFSARLFGATWYVNASATGSGTGLYNSDAWPTFASINQAALNPGDVVLIYPGTYNERFTVTKSGAPGLPITYKGIASSLTAAPSLLGILGGENVGYINILDLQIYQGSNAYNYSGIELQGATGWLIQDNYIHGINGIGSEGNSGSSGIIGDYKTVNSYNIIRCNTLQDMGIVPGSVNLGTNILVHGNHNLIEYNTIGEGNDRINVFGSNNIVRNNLFTPMLESDIPGMDPHIDDFQSYYPTDLPLQALLFERNFGDSNSSLNAHQMIIRDPSGVGGLARITNRFNISSYNGSVFEMFEAVNGVYTYNNTVCNAQAIQPDPAYYVISIAPNPSVVAPMSGIWYNNSFTDSTHTASTSDIIDNDSGGYFTVNEDYNHVYGGGSAAGAHSIVGRAPLFTNEALLIFTLQEGSPLIAAGGPLTHAVGAGALATTLVVNDAGGLCDGWGIADGDIIQVGLNAFVRLASGAINYSTNTITLPAPLSWNAGDPISVKGMSDMGALPHAYALPISVVLVAGTSSSIPGPGPIPLSAAVSDPDSVRMVQFLVDGVPVGTSYSAPYTIVWNTDGNFHRIEARAYNAWASQVLFVTDSTTVGI
jgi:hypothetical protein